MSNFIYFKEFNETTGVINSPDTRNIDSIDTDVMQHTFPIDRTNPATPAQFLLSDLVITQNSEVTITFIESYCTLSNTLLLYTYTGENRAQNITSIIGDIFVIPHARNTALDQGTTFKIPSTYTTSNYAGYNVINSVSSYTHPVGTTFGFILLSPYFNYVKLRDLNQSNNNYVSVIYSDYTKNKGPTVDTKTQVKYIKKTPTRYYLGFEDIPLSNPSCDFDFNDLVISIDTSASDSILLSGSANIPSQSIINTSLGSTSMSLLDSSAQGIYTKGVNQYINSFGNIVTGGTRSCYELNTNLILYSDKDSQWVLLDASKSTTVLLGASNAQTPPISFVGSSDLVGLYTPLVSVISGTTVSATTGNPISGSNIYLQSVNTSSNDNGQYELTYDPDDVNVITSQIRYVHHGYVDLYQSAHINSTSIPLSPVVGNTPSLRIVLSWGIAPTDLDSHLLTSTYEISYVSKTHNEGSEHSSLDVDDVTSYGPETVTVLNPTNRTYRYFVYDYSNETKLSSISDAQVRVYWNDTLIQNINISGATNWNDTRARYWHVFDITNSIFTKVHTFLRTKPSTPSS